MSHPYRTSMTMLCKFTEFMQPLLDPKATINENQLRAIHMLDPAQEAQVTKLR